MEDEEWSGPRAHGRKRAATAASAMNDPFFVKGWRCLRDGRGEVTYVRRTPWVVGFHIVESDHTIVPRPTRPRTLKIDLDLPRHRVVFKLAPFQFTGRFLRAAEADDSDHYVRSEKIGPERVWVPYVFLGVRQPRVDLVCKDGVKVVKQAGTGVSVSAARAVLADRGRVEVEEGDRRLGVAWMGPCCGREPQMGGAGEGAVGGHVGARADVHGGRQEVTVYTRSSDLLTPDA
jgi:hypothetical protein